MKTVASIVAASLLYATVRYNALKGVPWEEWPTFVVNKAAALSALLIVTVFLIRRRTQEVRTQEGRDQAILPRAAAWLIALHVTLSLAILSPATYPKFFVDYKPVATVAWSLLLGALAAAGMFMRSRGPQPQTDPKWPMRLGLLAFVTGTHAALLGYEGWMTPSSWPGFLAPITLIAFVAGSIGLLAGALPVRDHR